MQDGKDLDKWDKLLGTSSMPRWPTEPLQVAGEKVVPFYQPIISIASGRIVGYECLARSLNDKGNSRSFGHFFNNPKVRGDYQLEIDRALRYQGLKYFAEHPEAGYITLNISPLWIENILERGGSPMVPTLEMIKEIGIDPQRVVIEITESHGDIEMLKDMVAIYHEAGLMVAVDDFGAGASQADRVEALKPDIVKLDMRLFKQAARGGHSADIALSIAHVANRIGCHIVCEGVETEEEFHFGIECSSNLIQGYLFSEARPHTLAAESTIERVRSLQQSYLKEKSIRLGNASEQKQQIRSIVNEIKKNNLDAKALQHNEQVLNSGIFRYYMCDESGNQITPSFEKGEAGFEEDTDWQGMNWSHRPYFPSFLVLNKLAGKNFITSEVYRDLKTRKFCRTFACYLSTDRILLVDALVEDEILFVKE